MRAKEFTQVDEVAPFVAALGGALARGAASVGGALAKGALNVGSKVAQGAGQIGKQVATTAAKTAVGSIGSSGSTTAPSQQPQSTPAPAASSIPANTKIEQLPGSGPNNLKFKIGDATFSLDTKDPKNAQVLQQLGQLTQPK